MSAHPDATGETPAYQWAIGSQPDAVYVQLPPVDAAAGGGARDALRTLFRQRGFAEPGGDRDEDAPEPVTPSVTQRVGQGLEGDVGVANGCALVCEDDERALLVVSISDRIGATRIPLPHGDAAWSERVFAEGRALVVLTEDAIDAGEVTDDGLARDAEAGGLLAALVPAGQL